jgi:hypothetical protein
MKIFQNFMGLAFMLLGALPSANAATFNVLVGEQEVATLSLPSSKLGSFSVATVKLNEPCRLIKHGGGTLHVTNLDPFSTIEIKDGGIQLTINPGEAILFDKEAKTLYCVQNISIEQKESNCCLSAWRFMRQKLSCLKQCFCCS